MLNLIKAFRARGTALSMRCTCAPSKPRITSVLQCRERLNIRLATASLTPNCLSRADPSENCQRQQIAVVQHVRMPFRLTLWGAHVRGCEGEDWYMWRTARS